jgi:GDP-4-dehydro-6-deoxy-D-mannose reductase
MRTVLVTGATGFAGGHLVEALLAAGGQKVIGLARRASWPDTWKHLTGKVELRACDLTDVTAVETVLVQAAPQQIYHLAGYARVGASFREVEGAWEGNLTATRSLYEAVVRWGERPRILFVGSGLVYGGAVCQAHDEKCLLVPDSPYAASKAAADLASYQYTCHPGLDIVRARPFNHIGPHQQAGFALTDFASQLVAIERGAPAVIETGDLRPARDLTDVRDMVAAYRLLMDSGRTGEAYNIGRGESITMGAVLERLVALSGVQVEVRQRAELVRSTEPAVLAVDPSKLRRQTGWSPRYSLDQTLTDILAHWRNQNSPLPPLPQSERGEKTREGRAP